MNRSSNLPARAAATAFVGLALLAAPALRAQQEPSGVTQASASDLRPAGEAPLARTGPLPIRGVEAYASTHRLTAGFPDWHEFGLRGNYQAGDHVLHGEFARMRRWSESGVYAAIGDTYTLHPDWYGSLAVGAGDGASYLPRWRADAFLHRKLLAARNLIASAGAGYYRARDGHIDRNLNLGLTYYFEVPLIVQGEVRFTHSSPGSVDTMQQFLAATWGRPKTTTVTARLAWGEEGYQSIGQGAQLVNFRSREANLAVRHWFAPNLGLRLALDHYRNPSYRRSGVTASLFWELP